VIKPFPDLELKSSPKVELTPSSRALFMDGDHASELRSEVPSSRSSSAANALLSKTRMAWERLGGSDLKER
jgi:hypothetical protein